MKKIKNAQELFIEQLKGMHYKKCLQSKNLSKLLNMTSSEELRRMISRHINESKRQVEKLNVLFNKLNKELTKEVYDEIQGLISEIKEIAEKCQSSEEIDTLIIKSIQEINFYEKDLANLLNKSLTFEKAPILKEVFAEW